MKKKVFGSIFGLLAIACFILSLVAFFSVYYPTINIDETKLQYYVVSSYDDHSITCEGDKKLTFDKYAAELFDIEQFRRTICAGDQIFARVNSVELENNSSELAVYSVINAENEFLSLDKLNECYESSTTSAALILTFGFLLTAGFSVISILLLIKNKANR